MLRFHLVLATVVGVVGGCARSEPAASDATPRSGRIAAASASANQDTAHDPEIEWCVPRSGATIARLGTFSPIDSVATLGDPVSRDSGVGEDDGGEYSTTVLRFRRVEVHVDNRGFGIERIETTDTTLTLASGVRVGMSLLEAQDRLKAPAPRRDLANWAQAKMWAAEVCGDEAAPHPSETEALWLYVGDSGLGTRMALTNYGP
jgi:hypothetical protein